MNDRIKPCEPAEEISTPPVAADELAAKTRVRAAIEYLKSIRHLGALQGPLVAKTAATLATACSEIRDSQVARLAAAQTQEFRRNSFASSPAALRSLAVSMSAVAAVRDIASAMCSLADDAEAVDAGVWPDTALDYNVTNHYSLRLDDGLSLKLTKMVAALASIAVEVERSATQARFDVEGKDEGDSYHLANCSDRLDESIHVARKAGANVPSAADAHLEAITALATDDLFGREPWTHWFDNQGWRQIEEAELAFSLAARMGQLRADHGTYSALDALREIKAVELLAWIRSLNDIQADPVTGPKLKGICARIGALLPTLVSDPGMRGALETWAKTMGAMAADV